MTDYYGDFAEDDTVLIPFNTFDSNDPQASVTITNLADADIMVHKDGGLTQIATDGATVVIDFDSITGNHMITIDTSAHADYSTGSEYAVRIEGTTVDAGTINAWVGSFSIERAGGALALLTGATGLSAIDTVVDAIKVVTDKFAFTVANQVDSNAIAISGDTTAADNLELQYDTTGLTGDNFPATQAQVGNLATGSSAISTVAESDVVTTGSEVNTFAVTDVLDGVYHEISDDAGAMELYYQFDVGGNGVASSIEMTGRLFGANDSIDVFAYNWAGASWDQIGTMNGSNSSTDGVSIFNLLTRNTGTGANIGKVRVRGYAASGLSSATLYIDQAFVSYAVVAQSVGYANGAIWIDTATGTAGTEIYVNGVADNSVDSMADANTIDGTLNLDRFEISPDSSITLAATQAGQVFNGKGYALALGGQNCTGTHFVGGTASGVATTTGDEIHFTDFEMGACTLDASHLHNCGLTDTITLSEAATYTLQTCHSEIAGSGAPTIDFGAAVGNTSLNMRRYSGGIEIQNMGATGTDTMSLEGNGALTINANSVGGTIVLRGDFSVTGAAAFISAGGTITYDDNTTSIKAIEADTDELQTNQGNWVTATGFATETKQDATDIVIGELTTQGDTNETKLDTLTTTVGTAGAGLSDLGGMSTGMKGEVNAEADTALSDYDGPTNTEMETRTPTAAQLAYIVANAATGLPVTFSGTGTTTTGTLALVDGNTPNATDDQYKSRLLVFNSGSLDEAVTDITGYNGTTKVITVTAVPVAIASSHTARLI